MHDRHAGHDPARELRERLRRATHAPHSLPVDEPWNLAEIRDLVPDAGVLRPAAVLVPIVVGAHEARVILTRRDDRLTHHAGQISFPGGRVDAADASPVDAALRETEEEIGIAAHRVEVVGFLDPYATVTGFRITPVVGLIDAPVELVLGADEVAEAFEVPLAFVLDPARCETREGEFRGRLRRYHAYAWEARNIWGATASMLCNLARRWAATRP